MILFQYKMLNEGSIKSSIIQTITTSDLKLNVNFVKDRLDGIFLNLGEDISDAIITFKVFISHNNINSLTTILEQSCNHTDKLMHLIVIHKSGINNITVLSDSCLKIQYNDECKINLDLITPIFNQLNDIVLNGTTRTDLF